MGCSRAIGYYPAFGATSEKTRILTPSLQFLTTKQW
jgi:hypothetical protein